MAADLTILVATAASIAVLHTLLGPDHYLPFIVLGRAREWSRGRVVCITLLCGLGHVGSSLVIGGIGIALGCAVASVQETEAVRGSIAAWALIAFGFVYTVWGLRRAWKRRPHVHVHYHADGRVHSHSHGHAADHAHPHDDAGRLTPWVLFVVFVLGPCEPMIPLVMYPASLGDWGATVWVALVFSVVTVGTMLSVVLLGLAGLRTVRLAPLERWAHALAGAAILASGAAIELLGL